MYHLFYKCLELYSLELSSIFFHMIFDVIVGYFTVMRNHLGISLNLLPC